MLRCERFDAIEREGELEIHRLLGPKCSVVVKGRDAFGDRDEVRRAGLRHLFDEVHAKREAGRRRARWQQ